MKEIELQEIYLEAVKHDEWALCDVPWELRTEEICLDAVKRSGYALAYVPEELQEEIKKYCN